MAPSNRQISLPLGDFLDSMNRIAGAMQTYYNMSHAIIQASSRQQGAIVDAMLMIQNATKTALSDNALERDVDGIDAFPHIASLLKDDNVNSTLSQALADPFGIAPTAKPKKQKRQRKPKDPEAPKRPHTAYFLFQEQNREKFAEDMKKKNPDVRPGEIQKAMTEHWNSLSEDGQAPYKNKYRQLNEEYKQKMDAYKAQGGGAKIEGVEPDDAALLNLDHKDDEEDDTSSSSANEDDASSESSDDSSDESPPPPPTKSESKKSKNSKSKDEKKGSKSKSPESKKKRKHEADAEESQKKKKKNKDDGKKSKKSSSLIDPQLEKIDKEERRKKRKSQQYGADF